MNEITPKSGSAAISSSIADLPNPEVVQSAHKVEDVWVELSTSLVKINNLLGFAKRDDIEFGRIKNYYCIDLIYGESERSEITIEHIYSDEDFAPSTKRLRDRDYDILKSALLKKKE